MVMVGGLNISAPLLCFYMFLWREAGPHRRALPMTCTGRIWRAARPGAPSAAR
jgi:hypothetical protein